MVKISIWSEKLISIIGLCLVLAGLFITSFYNFLLFHSLAEIFSVAVAFALFMLAWNARRYMENDFLFLIALGFAAAGALDLMHTLSYTGMNVLKIDNTYPAVQLWIAARYIQAITLVLTPFFIGKRLNVPLAVAVYITTVCLALGLIFFWPVFPVCFIEGQGLTPFKKISEYIICMILATAILFFRQKQSTIQRTVLRFLIGSIVLTILSELVFTFYISMYGFSNIIGHFLKIIAFYLIYRAIVVTGLTKPYDLLFHKLQKSRMALVENEKHLIDAREMAEAASLIKSDFLATMSHELRTPLNAIIGFSEILGQKTFGELNAKQARYIDNILTSGRHLLGLINDILDLSKVEAGKLEIELSRINIKGLLENCLIMIKEKAMKTGIKLALTVEKELSSLVVEADERKLKQIMFNLLSNAVKFTPKGGKICVAAELISNFDENIFCKDAGENIPRKNAGENISRKGAKAQSKSNDVQSTNNNIQSSIVNIQYIRVSVTDNGIGIDPKDQDRIFGKFEQIDSTYARKQEGTGLGLALTRLLVELHSGRIWVESEGQGRGSRFVFIIPLGISD
ncbi:MAG: hypothetical protein HN417_00605 [Desulfobacula sp.]|jgi:signal transduction histidine kinase|nr:hypothetical protein [Desulfobacula sp.]MBT6341495.1 hypothetical protein [Desulfobacula sp.]MBT7259837.1 hypothetical protein [Desulfobacula sp.]